MGERGIGNVLAGIVGVSDGLQRFFQIRHFFVMEAVDTVAHAMSLAPPYARQRHTLAWIRERYPDIFLRVNRLAEAPDLRSAA